ncbi:hypothetical protein N836_25895 [Leptolyngbya sp. Heron Island J]|nr:hypothetical protein N836_25895 [Leptolyngbya sp. Heron Island J]
MYNFFAPLMPNKQSLTPPGDYEQFLTETKVEYAVRKLGQHWLLMEKLSSCIGIWGSIFWNVKLLKAGAVKSLIACPKT